jgi:hypothetical protein
VCATLLVPTQGLGELSAHVSLCVAVVVVLFSCLRMIPACFFYSLKEVQGYKMLACGVTLAGGDVVCTMEAWRWYSWHCCYMSGHVRHCLRSGFCPSVL